ncbi:AI-2 transport protein TqsA [Posidoniimonas corsicana]|uniref:AI-2 transport protein TqsA n=1 Tax=Posidoniimonas corsicana TaxID=1938618 RepID=A0A5C5VJJ9_9BACT|nr:AI-2E family transporter [Posidoniimonas corsicana]TWT37892.1 AI-2 transport protein TqsA [Posidoniimonas corsicana]
MSELKVATIDPTEESGAEDRPSTQPHAAHSTSGRLAERSGQPRERSLERRCLILLTGLAVFYTFYFTRAILLPMTLAVMLSLVLKPIVNRMHRWGVPHFVSATLVLTVIGVMTVFGARALWQPASEMLADAPHSLREVGESLRDLAAPIQQIQQAQSEMSKMTATPGEPGPLEVRIKQPALTSDVLSTTGGFATGTIIVFSLLFFLLAAGDRFLVKTVEVMPTWREKRDVVVLLQDLQSKISTYLGAITVINIALGATIGAGLWLIGMPNPLLWGVIAALLNYIPFAGLVIGTCLVFLSAMAAFPDPSGNGIDIGRALLAPAIYLGANGIEANVITPAVLGRSISLNPVVILLAVFIGGWVWGIGGIFLAVPILLVVKIACDHYTSLKPVSVFLAS